MSHNAEVKLCNLHQFAEAFSVVLEAFSVVFEVSKYFAHLSCSIILQ